MDDRFGEFEPQVGEIRAVRTFRIGPGGVLLPLFGSDPWTAGENTARCRRVPVAVYGGPAGTVSTVAPVVDHAVPEPECSCGFYAYASVEAARDYPHSEYVLAVVACWGRLIAGTRGVRAQHARVEAMWTSAAVPVALVDAAARRHPDVQVYSDRELMLREHPVTELDCYEPAAPPLTRLRTLSWRACVVTALAVGTVAGAGSFLGPTAHGVLWSLAAGLLLSAVVTGRLGAGDAASRRRVLMLTATVLWVAAGLAGTAGGLLVRLPLAELMLVGILNARRVRRAAATFPADLTAAQRAARA